MKNFKCLFFSLITSLILISCQAGFLSNEGYISLTLPAAPVSKNVRAADSQTLLFNVSVLSADEEIQSLQAQSLQTVSFTLSPGKYTVKIDAYALEDKAFEKPLYEGATGATVIAGQTSQATIGLKAIVYEPEEPEEPEEIRYFVKNVFNESGEYNYYLGLGIPEDSIALFKKDKAFKFTATFVPDTDFEGKLDFHYAHNLDKDGNNNWSLVYADTKNVSWKKGESFTVSFDFVVPYDLDPALDYVIGLSYFPDDLDIVTYTNPLEYKAVPDDTLEVVNISYHYGNQINVQKRIKGTDYTLITESDIYSYKYFEPNYLWLQVFNGWIEKGDTTNTIVTSIPAEQNTKDREFFLDYDLKFGKNEWDVGKESYDYHYRTEAPFSIFFPDITKSPAAGDHVKLVFTANAGKDFAGKTFNMDAELFSNEIIGWDYINSTDTNVTVDESGKLETYFDIEIPASRTVMPDLDHLILHLRYQKTTLDKEAVFTDWSIKLVDRNPFISDTASTKHMTVKTTDKGLHVTVQLLDTDDFTFAANTDVVDLDTQTKFRIDTELLNKNKKVEIDYPFCSKNEEMHMALQTNLNYTDGSGAWIEESAYVLAGGGIGKLDYTNYDKMVLTYNTDDYTLNLTNSIGIDWNTFLGQKLDVTTHYIDFSAVSGYKDWRAGTLWVSGQNLNLFDKDVLSRPLYKLFTEGKVCIFTEKENESCFFSSNETLDTYLAKNEVVFFDFSYHFRLNGYNQGLGSFATKLVQTAETPYTLKGILDTSQKSNFQVTGEDDFTIIITRKDYNFELSLLTVELMNCPNKSSLKYYWYMNGERVGSANPSDTTCDINLTCYSQGEYKLQCIITDDDDSTVFCEANATLIISEDYNYNLDSWN